MYTRRVGRPTGSKNGVSIKQISDACRDLDNAQRQKVLNYINSLSIEDDSSDSGDSTTGEIIVNLSESSIIPIPKPEAIVDTSTIKPAPIMVPTQPTPKSALKSVKIPKKNDSVSVKFNDWEGCEDVEDVEDSLKLSAVGFETYALMKSCAKNTITDEEIDEMSELCLSIATASAKLDGKLKNIKQR